MLSRLFLRDFVIHQLNSDRTWVNLNEKKKFLAIIEVVK